MLRIPCPHCGPRDAQEFTNGGEANIARPDPATASDAQWGDYLFMRDNPVGVVEERWVHLHGCRQWIVVRRDTRSNRVLGARAAAGGSW